MSIHTVGWPVSASEVQSLGFFSVIWNVFLFAFWSFDIISLYIISGYHFWYVLNLEIRQPKTTKDFFATNPIFLIWMAGGVHRFMGTAPQFSSHRCVKKSTARGNWTLQVQPQHLGGSDEQNSEGITSSPAVIVLGVGKSQPDVWRRIFACNFSSRIFLIPNQTPLDDSDLLHKKGTIDRFFTMC